MNIRIVHTHPETKNVSEFSVILPDDTPHPENDAYRITVHPDANPADYRVTVQ